MCADHLAIGMGRDFAGVFNLIEEKFMFIKAGFGSTITEIEVVMVMTIQTIEKVGELAWAAFEESLELVQMANEPFRSEEFCGSSNACVVGTALGNFGVDHVLDAFINYAPEPKAHPTEKSFVEANEEGFTGFCL